MERETWVRVGILNNWINSFTYEDDAIGMSASKSISGFGVRSFFVENLQKHNI